MEELDVALTPDQRVASLLDAQGFEVKEIARVTGFSVRSITKWRQEDDYKAEVDRLRDAGMAELQDAVRKVSKELLGAASLAVEALTSALEATKDDGSPDWYVIQRAAETILHASGGIISPKQAKSDTGNSNSVPFASITVNLDGTRSAEPERRALDVPEADVVED